MKHAVIDVNKIEHLLEKIREQPQALGYLPKVAQEYPYVMSYSNPVALRCMLEDTLLYHALRKDSTGLQALHSGGIDLVVFDRYDELMAPHRIEACVEDVFSGRRKRSRVGELFFNVLKQYIEEGDLVNFQEKIHLLVAMGGRRIMKSPVHIAGIRPRDFWHPFSTQLSQQGRARYQEGIRHLLDLGAVNIIDCLSRKLPSELITGELDLKDVSLNKANMLYLWREFITASLKAHTGNSKYSESPPLEFCQSIMMLLNDIVVARDVHGILELTGKFDMAAVYNVLQNAYPVSKRRNDLRDRGSATSLTSLLYESLPKPQREDLSSEPFATFDALMDSGMAPLMASRSFKLDFTARIVTDFEKYPDLFDRIYEKANLSEIDKHYSVTELLHMSLNEHYVTASFYLKRVREAENPHDLKSKAIRGLPVDSQEKLFESDGIMARFQLDNSDRKFSSAKSVREKLIAIDLGL